MIQDDEEGDMVYEESEDESESDDAGEGEQDLMGGAMGGGTSGEGDLSR